MIIIFSFDNMISQFAKRYFRVSCIHDKAVHTTKQLLL